MKNNNRQKGFTLIELLVVIAIISLLASVISVFARESREKAELAKGQAQAAELSKAVSIGRGNASLAPSIGSFVGDTEDSLEYSLNPVKDYILTGISQIPDNKLSPDKNYYYYHGPLGTVQCGEGGTPGEPMVAYKIEGSPKSKTNIVGVKNNNFFEPYFYYAFGQICYPEFPDGCDDGDNLACDTPVQTCEQTSSSGYFGCTTLK